VVNKNRIPGDRLNARVTSGVRFGTNSLALRGMGPDEMWACADLADSVLGAVRPLGDRAYELDPGVVTRARARVAELCAAFPIPGYAVEPPRNAEPSWNAEQHAGGGSPLRAAAPLDPYTLPGGGPA